MSVVHLNPAKMKPVSNLLADCVVWQNHYYQFHNFIVYMSESCNLIDGSVYDFLHNMIGLKPLIPRIARQTKQ